MRFAIFGNLAASKICGSERDLFALLRSLGSHIAIDSTYLEFLTRTTGWKIPYDSIISDNNFDADVVISIGGDGTFLRTSVGSATKTFLWWNQHRPTGFFGRHYH